MQQLTRIDFLRILYIYIKKNRLGCFGEKVSQEKRIFKVKYIFLNALSLSKKYLQAVFGFQILKKDPLPSPLTRID